MNKYLEETQEVVRLSDVSGDDIGFSKPSGKSGAFPQCLVLNSSRKEGRGVDLLPQIETRSRQ